MGQITPYEALALRWAELCSDQLLRDLPGKVELNAYGVIEMSPASNRRGIKQVAIAQAFGLQLPAGTAMVECSIATTEGVRVPDVAWASAEFIARHGDVTPYPAAPEICVEVRSPSNTDAEMAFKTRLFLEAGAVEVWIVAESGAWQVFDARGLQASYALRRATAIAHHRAALSLPARGQLGLRCAKLSRPGQVPESCA